MKILTDGGRQTADGGRRTADDGRQTTDDGRRTGDDGRSPRVTSATKLMGIRYPPSK